MSAYYNENDPKAAAWLRELIKAGHIADGEVDERSILDVRGRDLAGFCQCHFFAGIGGWSYALRIAGWPDDEPVWTGSCPCQPFSILGEGLGEADERHLWPDFRNLIGECNPPIVFGEQVASADGREWLAGVSADMENLAYRFAAADLCAACVGAPHRRQRLFWMANASREQWGKRIGVVGSQSFQADTHPAIPGIACGMADAEHCDGRSEQQPGESSKDRRPMPSGSGETSWLVLASQSGLEGHTRNGNDRSEPGRLAEEKKRPTPETGLAGDWERCDVLPFRDGKSRRVESGTFPLAHGVSGRVGLLRGYGNAIVPQLAAQFIEAAVEAMNPKLTPP